MRVVAADISKHVEDTNLTLLNIISRFLLAELNVAQRVRGAAMIEVGSVMLLAARRNWPVYTWL